MKVQSVKNRGMSMSKNPIVPAEYIENCIYLLRGQKVILSMDLAEIYGVTTKVFN